MVRKIIVVGFLGLSVVSATIFSFSQDSQVLAESDAIVRGLEEARQFGLIGEPTEITIAKMDRVEYWELRGEEITEYQIEYNIEVWVLDIRGEVKTTLWGGEKEFDNVVVVLDAKTGDRLAISARNPGYQLELPGQKVTLDDMGKFPIGPFETQVKPAPIPLPTVTPISTK